MGINIILALVQSLALILTIATIYTLYKTIKSNQNLNQRILFNEVIKQERELRIKLLEYREKINNFKMKKGTSSN